MDNINDKSKKAGDYGQKVALPLAVSRSDEALEPVISMGLSLLRDFLLCVPLILLLPLKLGIYGPLFSAPISDIISFLAVIAVMGYLKRILASSVAVKENA